MKILDEEKDVLRGIGFFFLKKALEKEKYEEAYVSACKTLQSMNITGIKKIEDKKYEITLYRPGLLIGAKGSTIDEIKKELKIKSISIVENIIPDYVFPIDIYRFEES